MKCLNEGKQKSGKKFSSKIIISVITIIAMFVLLLSLAGCTKKVTGTYYNQDNKNYSLELKSNGTFSINDDKGSVNGEYVYTGSDLTLITDGESTEVITTSGAYGQEEKVVVPSSIQNKCKVQDNIITEENGRVWVKDNTN